MGKQAKLPDIDFAKFGNVLIRTGKDAGKFIGDHAPKFLAGALSLPRKLMRQHQRLMHFFVTLDISQRHSKA